MMKPIPDRWLAIGPLAAGLLAGIGAWAAAPRAADPGAQNTTATVELNPAKQKHIWDAEHLAFELETSFGAPFVDALRLRDRGRMGKYFRKEFEAQPCEKASEDSCQKGIVSERRRRFQAGTFPKVGKDELIGSLIDSLAGFKQIEHSQLRVLRLDRAAAQTNLWKLELLLTFDGLAAAGGKAVLESYHHVEAIIDDDSRIGSGQVLARWRAVSESFRTSPRQLLEEVTQQTGLAEVPLPDNWLSPVSKVKQYSFQVAVEDFDRDGFPDIAVATLEGRHFLLRSKDGKKFEDVTDAVGLQQWPNVGGRLNFTCAWIDYDNDGFPDLVIGDRLYHNVSGKWFVDVTAQSQLKFHHHPMGCIVADYDCDGLPDLYVLYQYGKRTSASQKMPWVGDDESGAENELWHNEGNGVFRNVTAAAHAGGGRRHSFAAAWFFYDEDRFPDLYIANDFGDNVLLRNRGDGTFEDVSKGSGTTGFATSMGVAVGDLDNDGQPEIYVANMYSKMGRRIIAHVGPDDYPPGLFELIQGSCAGNRLFHRTSPQGRYVELSESMGVNAVGWAYAPAMVDLDGDGWLDLYAATGFLSFKRGKPDG